MVGSSSGLGKMDAAEERPCREHILYRTAIDPLLLIIFNKPVKYPDEANLLIMLYKLC